MIRKFREGDLSAVMDIWLSGNLDAHSFIPPSFFTERFEESASAICKAEVYVFDDGEVRGFIGLQEDYLAGLFVRDNARGKGIGTALLSHAVSAKKRLSVHVFARNEKALRFYLKNGFVPLSSAENPEAGESEVLLEIW